MIDSAVVQSIVAGAISGLGVVAFAARSFFNKIERIDGLENRVSLSEAKLVAVEQYGSKMDALTATISQVAADLAFLKGRLIQHDEWERIDRTPVVKLRAKR